jgi:hypothetical protein
MRSIAQARVDLDFIEPDQQESFCWSANPEVRRILDVIVDILGREYIRIAGEHPEHFEKKGEIS